MVNTLHNDLLGTETRYYQTPSYRTRVIEVRNGKMPLILMHGGGGHAEAYARNMIPLSAFSQPIAPDFIWHGLSSKPAFWDGAPDSGRHWLNQFTDQILELMDCRGIDRAVFEGESLGGWIAVDMGLRHPDRVAGLILNTAWGIKFDPAHVKDDPADMDGLLKSSLAALDNPSAELIRRRMEWLMPLGGVTDELVEVRRSLWRRPDTRAALTDYYHHLFAPDTDAALFTEEHLRIIKSRTLALWTTHNPFQGVDAAQRIGEIMPDASVRIIENAAHWPQWEKPEEHDRIVQEFLATL